MTFTDGSTRNATCAGTPATFNVTFNRLPRDATVTLVAQPVEDALTDHGRPLVETRPGRTGHAEDAERGPRPVDEPPASFDANRTGAFSYRVDALLDETRVYTYRWHVDGVMSEASRDERLHVPRLHPSGESGTGHGWSQAEDGDGRILKGSPNSFACERVEEAALIVHDPEGGDDERYPLVLESYEEDTWRVRGVPEDRPERRTTIEWRLTDGRVLHREGPTIGYVMLEPVR